MKFHSVHGANILLNEGGSQAQRTLSFCDAIVFSGRPVAVNSRISVALGANQEWSGALRLGVTANDPAAMHGILPRYACPDLIARQGFWARPLPEKWASDGTRLTFYVSSQGHFQLFVNNEHKGALFSGLPIKEQLWLLFDLYGITVTLRFVPTTGNAPVEVLARGPDALRAYQESCADGSVSLYRTRLALIGPPGPGKACLKKALFDISDAEDEIPKPIDTTLVCHTSGDGTDAWKIVTRCPSPLHSDQDGDDEEDEGMGADDYSMEEEYFQAIATNIVREIMINKKKRKQETRKKSALVRGVLRSQLQRISGYRSDLAPTSLKEAIENDDLPQDLPDRVVYLVEEMLREAETKQDWDRRETEKRGSARPRVTISLWDFDAHPKYFAMHQAFLSTKTLYILVIDLTSDPTEPLPISGNWKGAELPEGNELSSLEMIHVWLAAIHASVSCSNGNVDTERKSPESEENKLLLQPYVMIVATLSKPTDEAQVKARLNKLRESLSDKSYCTHVLPTYMTYDEDNSKQTAAEIRRKVEEVSLQLPHVLMEVPLKWLAFERMLERLIQRNIYLANLMQLSEVARKEGIDDEDTFCSMIDFYHQQGHLLHFDSGNSKGRFDQAVILWPQWFIDYAYRIFSFGSEEGKTTPAVTLGLEGVLTESTVEKLLFDIQEQSIVFLGILESLDLICEVENSEVFQEQAVPDERSFLIPWNIGTEMEAAEFSESPCSVTLFVDFNGLLPVGLFSRLTARICRWSERHQWTREPRVYRKSSQIAVDRDYDVLLKAAPFGTSLMEVVIIKAEGSQRDDPKDCVCPAQHICAKVRHLVEHELEVIRESWFNRIAFALVVSCPCEKECAAHCVQHCPEESCRHYLPLNQCLANKVVICDFRRVKTDFIRKYFPEASANVIALRNIGRRESVFTAKDNITSRRNSKTWDQAVEIPSWLKEVVRLLDSSPAGRDWFHLAKKLGYSEKEMTRFEENLQPSSSLLHDWLESNAGTRYSVDILLFGLEQIGREDIAELIRANIEPEEPAPPIFVSYQWDSQVAVLNLRRRLEFCGFPCWMDVGQMGGGDSLYRKIYEGISRAKVVLSCLTPRYVLSQTCVREASLADVLRKPIVPVVFEPVPWPPPGPLAVIFSPLVYVALCGIGGHGGNGKQADWESRFHEVVHRISQHVIPIPGFQHMSPPMPHVSHVTTPASIERPSEDFGSASVRGAHASDLIQEELVFEGDDISTSSSQSSVGGRRSPQIWHQHRQRAGNNRVIRCSICAIL